MERLLTIPESSARLGVSRVTIYRLIRDGSLRSLSIGRARRIPLEELERFVDDRLGVVAS